MRCLCLLVGAPGMDGPVPGAPESMQMPSGCQSATQAMATAGVLADSEREFLTRRLPEPAAAAPARAVREYG